MPTRLSIEIVMHSESDMRVIVNDNGKRSRYSYSDAILGLSQISHFLSESDVHKEAVYFEDMDGFKYPCTLSEYYAFNKPCGKVVWRRKNV